MTTTAATHEVEYMPAEWQERMEWNSALVCYPRIAKVQEFSDGNSSAYTEQELARVETLVEEILNDSH